MDIKQVLVLGGAGFLGSHVADALSKVGYAVRIFDRVYSPYKRPDQEMIVGDILDAKAVDYAVEGCQAVYNFAAIADLNDALHKPMDTVHINILGNVHVMEACRHHQVARYVYASTIYVYSREGSFYRCSKQAAENYIEEYQRVYNLDYTILRYGSLYGARSDESNGLYRIVSSALETRQVRYQGSPEALREYIHVDDAARASVVALGDEFRNESIVLTGQEPMRVHDLLKMLAEIMGLPEDAVQFVDSNYVGHYTRTPYAYQPKLGRKYIPPMHIDLGQGLLQLINEIKDRMEVC
ncbi:MAG: NAD(P)-dependent oxidoreductase [Gammaproteobacteria bacterium]|nr:NAD(P)-dependent oxidoreductase [Gammaproteobacteria bacterium]